MVEVLVDIETAKLAKEKGFHTCCGHYFLVGLKENGIVEVGKWKGFEGSSANHFSDRSNETFEEITRPSQSLLQQWLRKKYNLHVTPRETFTYALTTNIGFYANVIKPDPTSEECFVSLHNAMYFESEYETALEIGLKEALKTL